MGKKSRRLQFHGSRSSTSLDRSVLLSASNANHNSSGNRAVQAWHKGQKIAFSRKFPFMSLARPFYFSSELKIDQKQAETCSEND